MIETSSDPHRKSLVASIFGNLHQFSEKCSECLSGLWTTFGGSLDFFPLVCCAHLWEYQVHHSKRNSMSTCTHVLHVDVFSIE